MYASPRRRLNACLDPDEFEIFVPKRSTLLGGWRDEEAWKRYLCTLCDHPRHRRRRRCKEPVSSSPCCDSCPPYLSDRDVSATCQGENGVAGTRGRSNDDFSGSWILRGRFALRHARRVHRALYLPFLQIPGVSAVDLGFALVERHNDFRNLLSLRLHLAQKDPFMVLHEKGRSSLTTLLYLLDCCCLPTEDPCDPQPCDEPSGPGGASSEGKKKKDDAPEALRVPKDLLCYLRKWASLKELRTMLRSGLYDDYPVGSVRRNDLGYVELPSGGEPQKDYRLTICGVPVDVIGKRYFPASPAPRADRTGVFADPLRPSIELDNDELLTTGRSRVSPIVGGISLGSRTGQAGTLGAVVWDRTDGTPCILSNWHVLAGSLAAQVGQPCYQPALFDGGTAADTVGHLKRWLIGDEGDAAIAELNGQRSFSSAEILGMWHPISGTKEPALNMHIRKWGRTTGFTEGFIDGVDLAVNLDYGGGGTRHFTRQFHIAPLYEGGTVSHVGDSGALVLAYTNLSAVDRKLKMWRCLLRWLCEENGSEESKGWKDVLDNLFASVKTGTDVWSWVKLFLCLYKSVRSCGWERPRGCSWRWEHLLEALARDPQLRESLAKELAAKPSKSLTGQGGTSVDALDQKLQGLLDSGGSGRMTEAAATSNEHGAGIAGETDDRKSTRKPASADQIAELTCRFDDLEQRLRPLFARSTFDDLPPESVADVLSVLGYDPDGQKTRAYDRESRLVQRAYFAVGMIFAGDTPGSPLGEFALASNLRTLEKELNFSLRPVFETRSSFRYLRSEAVESGGSRVSPPGGTIAPQALGDDPRPGGPQPEPESSQGGGGG